jgi:Ca-activated chloride channel family protein
LRLRLLPAPDVRMTLANDLPEIDGEWRLPDLARGSEVWALVRLRLAAAEVANGLQVPLALLSASLRYEGEAGGGFAETAPLVLPALAAGSFDAVAEDELVARRAQEVRFADYQRDAAAAARQGDWANVDAILVQARDAASGHDWLASSLTSLERYAASRSREEYAKEASFKSHRMMSRPVSPSEAAAFDVRSDAFMPSFLQRRREEGKSGDGQPGAGGAAAPGSEPEPLKPPSLFGRTKRDGGQ